MNICENLWNMLNLKKLILINFIKMKKSLSIILLFSILLSSCWKTEEVVVPEIKEPKIVKSKIIKKTPIKEQLKIIWKVTWDKEVIVSAQVSWLINLVMPSVGDNVGKWDILATIDTNSQIWVNYQNSITALNNSNSIYNYSKESIDKDVESSKLALEVAKVNKENTYNMTEKQLSISQKQLDNIKSSKDNTLLSNDESIKSAKIAIDLAQKAYDTSVLNITNFNKNKEETKKSLIDSKKSLVDTKKSLIDSKKALLDKKISILRSTVSTIQNSYINLESSETLWDTIFWLTDKNKYQNDSFETYLWAKNTSQRISTESELTTLIWNYNKNISYIQSLDEKLSSDIKNIDFYTSDWSYVEDLDKTLWEIVKTKKMLSDMLEVFNNSINASNFSTTVTDWYKASIAVRQASILQSEWLLISLKSTLLDINNSITNINNSIADRDNSINDKDNYISSTITNLDTQLTSLENAVSISKIQLDNAKQALASIQTIIKSSVDNISWNVDLTKEQLNNTISIIKNSRDQVDNWVKVAETQMNSTLAKLNSWLIQTKAQVDNTKWQSDLAKIALKNSVISSPLNATIVSKMVEVWSLVNPWTPLFNLISSDKVKVKVDISSENISYLQKWQSIKLELINWNTATWTIELLSKNADQKTNLFLVEISFDNKILKSKIWEFVNIYIDKTIWNKDWIMVPFESIINVSPWIYNVFVINWSWTVISREVKLWVKNSENVEINSWLKEWEKIAISKVWDLEDWDIVKEKN